MAVAPRVQPCEAACRIMGAAPLASDHAKATSAESASATASGAGSGQVLDLFLANTKQLFNSMDPSPFRERDLDPGAETYIVEWAGEARVSEPLSLVLHLGDGSTTEADAAVVRDSVHEFFRRRAFASRRRLQRLFRLGRYSLLIALIFLTSVTIVGESLASLISSERSISLIENSLLIGAWVALWRPLEIFLYDWWPIRAEAKLFDRLSLMHVQVVGIATAERAGASGPRG